MQGSRRVFHRSGQRRRVGILSPSRDHRRDQKPDCRDCQYERNRSGLGGGQQGHLRLSPWLEEKLYGIDEEPDSNPVPVHIHHLRRQLEAAGASLMIHTIRGVGYILAETKA